MGCECFHVEVEAKWDYLFVFNLISFHDTQKVNDLSDWKQSYDISLVIG